MANSFIGRSDLPRGLRNNNPGNIKTGEAWQGAVGDDGTFVIFKDISWGTRALSTDLANKIREGHNTITSIIEIYAPPSENDTASYIAAVSDDTGLDPGSSLSMDGQTLHNLVRAIMNHENGNGYSALVTDADIDQGISMMNPTLVNLFQAAAIAAESSVEDLTGGQGAGSAPGGAVLLLVLLGVVLLFSSSKD